MSGADAPSEAPLQAPYQVPFQASFLPPVAPDGLSTTLDAAEAHGIRWPLLGGDGIHALARRLRAARREALAGCPVRRRAALIGRAGQRFLDTDDPFRREAEARLPATAALSPEMARAVIDGMARDWTEERLLRLLTAELHDPSVLDAFASASPGTPGGLRVRAYPPALSFHVGAGTVPGVAATSLVRALLVGSAVLVKPGRGDVVLPVLLARALAEEAPELAAMAAVAYWEGGTGAAEEAAFSEADLVVVYGGDDTVHSVRTRVPPTTRLVAYHHRLSAAVIGRDALAPDAMTTAADQAAHAVAMFDQRGCVSPHVVYVEEGGASSPRDFAVALATALERAGRTLPAAPLTSSEASWVQQLRRTVELRAAAGEPVAALAPRDLSWTVVLEPPASLEPCVARTVRVHPVADADDANAYLAELGPHLQTVGVAGFDSLRLERLAGTLGEAGAVRICRLSDVPFPPPWWHHDGLGPLRALLRWVDLEG